MNNYTISISKDQLAALPAEKFSGEIVVVANPEDVDIAADFLEKAPLIGFDTETKPSFQKGHINKVALLQLATETKTFLIKLSSIGFPERIKALLENKNITKVGLSIKDDFHSLAKITEFSPGGFIDLQDYVKNFCITDISLTKIHAILFNRRISKSQQLSNWEASAFTRKQMEYAALDALACVNIYKYLRSGEFKPEESPYFAIKD